MTDGTAAHAPERQKELGAFYTPPAMAAVLTEWAVRAPSDRLLDPSFGGLVFLAAAHERLRDLGAPEDKVVDQLFGVDLDEHAHATGVDNGFPLAHLVHRDFFEVDPVELPPFDAVVGNPPYIRYQGFNETAARARKLADNAGVPLTRLASSWAPFVIHATSFVAGGGRLAQVLPAELLHAQYADDVMGFLRRAFGRISIALFEERVFPGALEEVVLLFADDRGGAGLADVHVIPCHSVPDVRRGLASAARSSNANASIRNGRSKLLTQLLPADTRALYESLAIRKDVSLLGEEASVDIGVVTGANDFFVLQEEGADGLHPDLLQPAVCKASQVAGTRLTTADHQELLRRGERGLMFVADGATPAGVLRTAESYIEQGKRAGFHERYKCRIRDPWWALPMPKQGVPDLLLTYCSSEHPRLAANEIGALNTNTLHGVRPFDASDARCLAAGFYNSLTMLSAELVGRSYGGGVLKLEPTEAEALLLPPITPELEVLLPEIDQAIRARNLDAALDLVDPIALSPLELGNEQIAELRAGRQRLQERRRGRRRPARSTRR